MSITLRTKLYIGIICAIVSTCGSADATSPAHSVTNRFTATKPGVVLTYQISYHVIGLKLLRIGEARCYSVEGLWRHADGSEAPAFFSAVFFDTHDDRAAEERKRVSIHNAMISVMTNPDLKTLIYFKHADEYLNPFFKQSKHEYYLDFYAVENGSIDYLRKDYHTGHESTELQDADALLEQSHAIAAIIKRMSDVYHGHAAPLTHESDFRVFFNVEGEVKPFAAKSSMERLKIVPIDRKLNCMRVDISRAPETTGKAGSLSLWGVPFSKMAKESGDEGLITLAGQSPEWSMIPVRMTYERPIGYIRCHLETMQKKSFDDLLAVECLEQLGKTD